MSAWEKRKEATENIVAQRITGAYRAMLLAAARKELEQFKMERHEPKRKSDVASNGTHGPISDSVLRATA